MIEISLPSDLPPDPGLKKAIAQAAAQLPGGQITHADIALLKEYAPSVLDEYVKYVLENSPGVHLPHNFLITIGALLEYQEREVAENSNRPPMPIDRSQIFSRLASLTLQFDNHEGTKLPDES